MWRPDVRERCGLGAGREGASGEGGTDNLNSVNNPAEMVVPRVQAAIASAFGEEYRGTDPVVRPSQFADIQINAAMALAKKVGLPPRDAAARIVEALDLDGICTGVEISGPGFINLTFDGTWIEELLNAESPGVQARGRRREAQRVVVDYSSPNVAKEMHVGHLRTTVVGDSLVKVFEALGDTVIRQNHIGDWGTPFGMLIEHWLEIGEDSPEAALLVDDPSAFYQAARAKFDASATDEDGFATRARLRVVALQGGDAGDLRRLAAARGPVQALLQRHLLHAGHQPHR